MHRSLRKTATGPLIAALLLAGCGGDDGAAGSSGEDDDGRIGGTIRVMGVLGGDELESFLGAFAPFEQRTGITIEYEGTGDLQAVLQTRLDGGNPPDIVSNPSAGQMQDLATAGELIPVGDIIDETTVLEQFPQSLVDLVTIDDELFGIPGTTAVAGLVWYRPDTYDGPTSGTLDEWIEWVDSAAAEGRTPFCIGLESGPASGWPGASFIQQLMLQRHGADAYNAWWQGDLPWSSPEVRGAFETFRRFATDPAYVSGGADAALTGNFADSAVGLFDDPPSCLVHVQGDWLGNAMAATVPDVEPATDIDFLPFPAAEVDTEPVIVTSGETFGAFRDSPQTRAFMSYVASPQFSELIAATGSWIGPNRDTPLDAYQSELSRKAATTYLGAESVVVGAQDGMPAAMSSAFHNAVMELVAEPSSLDAILAQLDEVRAESYVTK
jgi:alpha-glucoside transport system substrate-binding protein